MDFEVKIFIWRNTQWRNSSQTSGQACSTSLLGDYYLIAGEDEPESRPIGIWEKRHLLYLKQHRKVLYSELLISGKLNDYLADLNEQAAELFSRQVKQLAEKEGVTEALKAENQMLWVQKMNNIHNAARYCFKRFDLRITNNRKGCCQATVAFLFLEVFKKL